ncbi:hypothetical protein [Desulfosporosinus nitroreducens]|uniref:hypothetical protein n=1 Tax=Desulfosporosinus nitroreducens TaxID=2018668 RepID=UPI00207C9ACA|nr:hypothetical protein [Desulfosporosinus nitroreducens]MCO1602120.1 hypothetical protein [Desulfosporosinus nitroreducens]
MNSQRKVSSYCLEDYAIISVTGCRGTVSHTLQKGGGRMISMVEAMYLMIAFATLVVLIIKKK